MAPTVCTHCLHRLPLDPLLDDDFRMALHPDGLRHGFASHHVEPSVFATVLKPTCLPPCVFFIHVEYIIQAWPMCRVLCLKVPRFQECRMANDQYFKVADSKVQSPNASFAFLVFDAWVQQMSCEFHPRTEGASAEQTYLEFCFALNQSQSFTTSNAYGC